ncbi:hypothetical protein D1BOALGB6SA_7591 [Olavius sp. associated proteobacterium Delta 1]|nr:hypothetical protein D1BOALGB6SA_7591 [Olavius sp. associated proteobacterium Delta 1]
MGLLLYRFGISTSQMKKNYCIGRPNFAANGLIEYGYNVTIS